MYVCVCVYIYIYTHTYTHTNLRTDCIRIAVATNNTTSATLTQICSGTKCRPDIYHWGAGLAVTGRIRDIGENVLKYSFVTRSSSSPSYCHILLLIATIQEAVIRNAIIILCITCNT